jgi:dihydrofolate synthase/folylpolyglutamate synthase
MADKDLPGLFKRLMPLVECWYFCDLPTPRAATARDLQLTWQSLSPPVSASSAMFESPVQALAQALAAADPTDRILVFGSFFTVGAVLQHGIDGRLPAYLPT